jgi:hypothetical protein
MPKYRFLSDEELLHFEDEFKKFLIVNHVYKEEWQLINQDEPEKATELVGLFSDQILQRIYENIKYLELHGEKQCSFFDFQKEKADLILIKGKENSTVSLSSVDEINNALANNFEELEFYCSSKDIDLNREGEIHQLLEKGAIPSTKEFWETLQKIKP